MTRQEAMFVLQSLRLHDADTSAFAEALALAETDPVLKEWWEAQQQFDRRVSAKLAEIEIPEELLENILAAPKVVQFSPPPSFSFWLAAAAAVAILCVVGIVRHNDSFGPLDKTEYATTVIPFLDHDAPSLAMASSDREKITAWLKRQNAPMGTLPTKMDSLTMVGCQRYMVHGHAVSLICFVMEGGGIAHLFVVDRNALTDPPALHKPEFNDVNGWSTAAWSDGGMSYLLATQAGGDALKKLL